MHALAARRCVDTEIAPRNMAALAIAAIAIVLGDTHEALAGRHWTPCAPVARAKCTNSGRSEQKLH
jgi:hypothetical protein